MYNCYFCKEPSRPREPRALVVTEVRITRWGIKETSEEKPACPRCLPGLNFEPRIVRTAGKEPFYQPPKYEDVNFNNLGDAAA